MGMDSPYTDSQYYSALKQSNNDLNLAVQLLIDGVFEQSPKKQMN